MTWLKRSWLIVAALIPSLKVAECTHADHAGEPGALGSFPESQIGGIGGHSRHGVEHHTVADEAHLPGAPGATSQPDLGKCQISKSHKPCTQVAGAAARRRASAAC